MPERLAVIGGDGAGMSAANAAKRRNPELEVVAFERGAHTSYGACGIPYYVGGMIETADDLIARTPEEHHRRGIDVRIRTEAVAIDLAARTLTVRNTVTREETTEPFDQLVIATGAVATPPPIPGAEAAEPARTIETAERLRSDLETRGGERAVVIGAGYIGLEMAENLVHRGLREVTLIDRAPQVMATLDADMALHVQAAAEGEGITVLLNVDIDEIELDDGRPVGVRTSEGRIAADHVLIGTGAKPAVDVARAAGLEIGETGAIAVDDHMRVPGHDGVFAAGDCVESHHRILDRPANIQLGTHANQQGRIAGINATGGDLAFPGVLGTAISRICRYEIGRTGISEREATEAGIKYVATTIESRSRAGYYPRGGPVWVKLLADPDTGRLLGGQIVGVKGAGKRIDTVATALWAGMTAEELQFADLAYAPPMSPTLDPVIMAARALTASL